MTTPTKDDPNSRVKVVGDNTNHRMNFSTFIVMLQRCLILVIFLFAGSCQLRKPNKAFKIDARVKDEALMHTRVHISDHEYTVKLRPIESVYRNDTLLPPGKDTASVTMGLHYFWAGDSTVLALGSSDGMLDGAEKFLAWIHGGELVKANYFLWSHGWPYYKLQPNDTPAKWIDIPCSTYDLTISHLPNSKTDDTIYGKVSFKTADYYVRSYTDTTKYDKYSVSMSFWFRADGFSATSGRIR